MKLPRIITIFLFLFLIITPVIEARFHFFEEVELKGIEKTEGRPHWQWQNWLKGNFQTDFENWFGSRIGFRGFLVKTNNQLNFSIFKEVNSSSNVHLVLGKENWLYEKGYLDSYNNRDLVDNIFLQEKVRQLKILQDKLLEKRINFLLLISPNKAVIYPEFLPDNLIDYKAIFNESNYERLVKLLNQNQVNYFDSVGYLLRLKNQYPFTLFVKGGTHWDYFGACKVSSELINKAEQISKKDLINISCEPTTVDQKPTGKDLDLADLTNIWTEEVFAGDTPHPYYSNNKKGQEFLPKVLLVGDSFSWQILEIMESQKVYKERDFLYYNESDYHYPDNISQSVKKTEWDWNKIILNKNLVILEINQSGLAYPDFGFPEEALKFLNNK